MPRARIRPLRVAALACVLGLVAAAPDGAAAQGLFDFLFGGYRRAAPPPQVRSYAPAEPALRSRQPRARRAPRESRRSGAPRVAYCVRLCDGRYFPIQAHADATPAELCGAFCPASETKLYYGRSIDHAIDRQGKAYSALDSAFVYRERIVPGCSCDGRSSFGVARLSVDEDPTLREGDIVATRDGLMAYNGGARNTQAAYTPIDDAKIPRSLRKRLSELRVGPAGSGWYQAIAVPLPVPRPKETPARLERRADGAQQG